MHSTLVTSFSTQRKIQNKQQQQTGDLLGRGTVRYWKNLATGQAGRSQAHSTSSLELLLTQHNCTFTHGFRF